MTVAFKITVGVCIGGPALAALIWCAPRWFAAVRRWLALRALTRELRRRKLDLREALRDRRDRRPN